MNEGLVSVIMPCYNGEEFLAQALNSVEWQTYKHWECILIDDGSTDTSPTIFKEFAERDSRFHYHRKQNAGLAAARNTGIELAQGEFIQFLDDDDIISEQRLQICVEQFRLHPDADVVYTDYVRYQQGDGFFHVLPAQIPGGDTFLAFLLEQDRTFTVLVHSLFFTKKTVEASKFDAAMGSHLEDMECWIRIAESGARFHYVDEVLAIYRASADALTSDESVVLKAKLGVLRRYEHHPKVRASQLRFYEAMNHFQERLIVAYFMNRSFNEGLTILPEQLSRSRWKGKLKMLGWFVLMSFFSKRTLTRTRMWIVSHTSFKWGGWKYYRQWTPPESIQKLMFS